MPEAARTRIKRYKPHGSGVWVHTFPDRRYRDEAFILAEVKETLAEHSADVGHYGGFAFVVWDRNGASTVGQQVFEGCVITMGVPNFVRERLMADRIEQWVRMDL